MHSVRIALPRYQETIRATIARAYAFGVLLANFPGGDMGVIQADENGLINVHGVMRNIWEMPLHDIAHELGLMNFIYYMLIKTGFLPPIIFMGAVR